MSAPRPIDPATAGRGLLRAAIAAIGAAAFVLLAACGVPGSGSFQRINPPAELSEATSTSAPRTTLLPPTTPPPTPTLATTSTTEAPTTSTVPVYDVSLYFVAGPNQLTPITRQLAGPLPQPVLAALTDPTALDGPEFQGLSTALPFGTQLIVTVANGLATVDFPPTMLANIPRQDQTLAVAQIVLTLTARPGIGQVRFTSEGEPQQVSKADGSLTNPGDDLVCEDYRELAPDAACG